MRKIILIPLFLLTVSVFVATGISRAGGMYEGEVNVKLSAIPEVKTDAGGNATFTLSEDGAAIHYRLHLDKIENVTMSHIHTVGEDGKRGSVIVWLYPTTGMGPSLKEGEFSGSLAEGVITSDKLAGPWKGRPVKDLLKEIGHGTAGVAVHTKQNPGTELWGAYKRSKYAEKEHMGKEPMEKEQGKSSY